MDEFTTAYIEAMLWAETSGVDEEERPDERSDASFQDHGFTATDLAPETLDRIKADCAKFQAEHGPLIELNLTGAGHDFWLTRQGHGAGFWDGDWPDPDGDTLTEACKAYGELYPYVGDDGLIYFT